MPDDQVDDFVNDLARRLCLFDREALRTAKRQVNRHTLPMNGEIESSYLLSSSHSAGPAPPTAAPWRSSAVATRPATTNSTSATTSACRRRDQSGTGIGAGPVSEIKPLTRRRASRGGIQRARAYRGPDRCPVASQLLATASWNRHGRSSASAWSIENPFIRLSIVSVGLPDGTEFEQYVIRMRRTATPGNTRSSRVYPVVAVSCYRERGRPMVCAALDPLLRRMCAAGPGCSCGGAVWCGRGELWSSSGGGECSQARRMPSQRSRQTLSSGRGRWMCRGCRTGPSRTPNTT